MVKNPPAKAGDSSLISGSGRSPGEVSGNLLWQSCLETRTDRGAWRAADHGVTRGSWTRLRDLVRQQLLYKGQAGC